MYHLRRQCAGTGDGLNMFGSDGRQNIIINNSKIYGNATGRPLVLGQDPELISGSDEEKWREG